MWNTIGPTSYWASSGLVRENDLIPCPAWKLSREIRGAVFLVLHEHARAAENLPDQSSTTAEPQRDLPRIEAREVEFPYRVFVFDFSGPAF